MNAYYCIVNLPGVPVREIVALKAADDTAAVDKARTLLGQWPGYETVTLYDGERPVAVLANPGLGFALEPLALRDRAA